MTELHLLILFRCVTHLYGQNFGEQQTVNKKLFLTANCLLFTAHILVAVKVCDATEAKYISCRLVHKKFPSIINY